MDLMSKRDILFRRYTSDGCVIVLNKDTGTTETKVLTVDDKGEFLKELNDRVSVLFLVVFNKKLMKKRDNKHGK